MSHHFDTPTAKEDPRINVCDFYLFRGRPGTTVMALTVNPNAGVGAPDTFRDEGLYAFRASTRIAIFAKTSPSRSSSARPPTPMAASTGTFRPSRSGAPPERTL
jgi:hypothetical protein